MSTLPRRIITLLVVFTCGEKCFSFRLRGSKPNKDQITLDVLKEGLHKTNFQRKGFFGKIDLTNQSLTKYLEPLIQEIIKSKQQNKTYTPFGHSDRPKQAAETKKANYDPELAWKNLVLNNSVPIVYPSGLIDDEDREVSSGGGVDGDGSGEEEFAIEGSGTAIRKTLEGKSVRVEIKKNTEIQHKTTATPPPSLTTKKSTKFILNSWRPIPLPDKSSNVIPTIFPRSNQPDMFMKSDAGRKTIQIYYYGPCLFCQQQLQRREGWKNIKRKKLRQKLVEFDFVILVQKHQSGMFTTLLSFGLGRTLFPEFIYLQIHPPITCNCFSRAPNKRYLLVGEFYHGRMVLNNFHPLYEIDSYIDVEEIQRAMVINQNYHS